LRIDSHQHFTAELLPSLLGPILKRNRFDGSIVVTKRATLEDTRWLLDLAEEHQFIRGVVGWADLTDVNIGRVLDEYQRHPKFRGVCYSCVGELPRGLSEIERRELTLDLHPHLECVPRIADRYNGLRMVIDHLGRRSFAPMQFDEWARTLEITAQLPRVFAKLSGLISDAPTQWKAEDFQPYARHALRVFGPERVMFGSDWPTYLPTGTWKEALAAFTQAIGARSMEAREQLLGGTALRFYGLELGASIG
jgi:L-fuconolactonase